MRAYIGVDGGTYRELIQPTEITITRAEGPIGRCGIARTRDNWHAANSVLRDESDSAPASGGYDKHDFVVKFADGYEYSGRYDLKHWSVEPADLAAHCRAFLSSPFAVHVRHLLDTHDFLQGKVPIPADVTPEIVADYRPEDLRWVSPKELAAAIRAALKSAYPDVVFRVRKDEYSMGSTVYVSWTDGPTSKAVDELLNQFRGKSFRGDDDSTHYHPIIVNGEKCRAGSYISTSRDVSEPIKARIKARVAMKTADPDDHWDGYWPTLQRTHVVGATLVIEKPEHERGPVAQPDNVVSLVRNGRPD